MDKRMAESIMEGLSEKDISDLIMHLIQHRLDTVLSGSDDLDYMANNALSEIFSKSNALSAPTILGQGIVAIPCYTQHAGKKHKCANATVKVGDRESWCWDENLETYLSHAYAQVGNSTRMVSLHLIIPGMRITRHFMEHDGERHRRVKEETFILKDEGSNLNTEPVFAIEEDMDFVAGKLPLPASK